MRGEFDFIEKIRKSTPSPMAKVGIGDDCAVLPKDSVNDLVITTDLLVEDIDFKRTWLIPEYLGHKALAVSLSDIAAMGGTPTWAMLSIGIPEDIWDTDFVDEFYRGWFGLAEQFNVSLVGGDVSRTPDKIIIDSIAAGDVKKDHAILRSGAMAGDLIFVTGQLGAASVGLRFLEKGKRISSTDDPKIRDILLRQLRPSPQVAIAQILADHRLATSMIDLSDGLSGDLGHLCRQSRVGAEIDVDMIPIDDNLTGLRDPSLSLSAATVAAIGGGEDFELLFTIRPQDREKLIEATKNFSVSEIGKITVEQTGISMIEMGNRTPLTTTSYNHF